MLTQEQNTRLQALAWEYARGCGDYSAGLAHWDDEDMTQEKTDKLHKDVLAARHAFQDYLNSLTEEL